MSDLILGQPEPPRTRLGARFAVFGLVIVIVIGLLTTRLFYIQVVSGGYYSGLSQDQLSDTQPIPAARGAAIASWLAITPSSRARHARASMRPIR